MKTILLTIIIVALSMAIVSNGILIPESSAVKQMPLITGLTDAIEESNRITMEAMETNRSIWYEGYNNRYMFLYDSTDPDPDRLTCTYWDIVLERELTTWCEDGSNSVDNFDSQRI